MLRRQLAGVLPLLLRLGWLGLGGPWTCALAAPRPTTSHRALFLPYPTVLCSNIGDGGNKEGPDKKYYAQVGLAWPVQPFLHRHLEAGSATALIHNPGGPACPGFANHAAGAAAAAGRCDGSLPACHPHLHRLNLRCPWPSPVAAAQVLGLP